MAEGFLLGIDIGTSSTKGVLARTDGAMVASTTRAHATSMPRPGWFEHDAGTWWDEVCAISAELLDPGPGLGPDGRRRALLGVCVSGLGPCLQLTDAAGRPTRPAILYGVDTRAEAEIDELTARYGDEAILERCGSRLTSQSIGPKLAWVARHEPEAWAASRRMFMAGSYAAWRLTGAYVLDHHSASQSGPLYDIEANGWAADWAGELAGQVELPRLAWPAEPVGRVHAEGAAASGIPEGTPVAAGTVDAWSEALSVGVRDPGDVMVMYGTTMFIVALSRRLHRGRQTWGTTGYLPGSWSVASGMATSGSLMGWWSALTGADAARLGAEAAEVAPGSDGLLALPYFAGERTPIFDPSARGYVAGLTLAHTRGHVQRALMEGIAYGVRDNLEAIAGTGASLDRLVAVGGGLASPHWVQIVSDVTGRSQELPEVTIGAAYGDALLAGMAAGAVPPDTRWGRVSATVEPDERWRDRYDALFQRYHELFRSTIAISHHLAGLQAEGGQRGL